MAPSKQRRKYGEPDEYVSVMLLHLALLSQVSEKRNLTAVGVTYDKSLKDFLSQLHKVHRRSKGVRVDGKPLTGYEAQQAVAQVRKLLPQMSASIYATLLSATKDAQTTGLRTIIDSVEKLERDLANRDVALSAKQPARFNSILDQRNPEIERSTEDALVAYTRQTAEDLERQLTLSVALEETFEDAMDRVSDALLKAKWKVDRISRTESAFGFNAALYDGVSGSARELPELGYRWTEHVYDLSGQPMDDRVASDSLALHGQVASANGIYTMPADARVRPSMWGETYRFPPNRPNDRAVLVPWMPTWGVPGYRYVGGRPMGIAVNGSLTGPLPPNLNPAILPTSGRR